MRRRVFVLIAIGVLAGACRDSKNMKRSDQNYDVVQEGTTGETTSTISGPGETPPPAQINAPPMTATNTDNTTAFALPQTATATTTVMTTTSAGVGAGAPLSTQLPAAVPATPRPHPHVTKPRAPENPATDTITVPPRTTTTTSTTTEEPAPPTTTTTDQPPPPTDTSNTAHPPR